MMFGYLFVLFEIQSNIKTMMQPLHKKKQFMAIHMMLTLLIFLPMVVSYIQLADVDEQSSQITAFKLARQI